MLKEQEAIVRKGMILIDAFIISFALIISHFLRQKFSVVYKLDLFSSNQVSKEASAYISEYLIILALVVPIWCCFLYLHGMYSSLRTRTLFRIVWIVIKSSLFMTLVFGTIVFFFKLGFISRLFYAVFLVLGITFIILEKTLLFSTMHYVRKRGYNYRSLLIVGTGSRANKFIKRIKNHPEWGLRIIGVINDGPEGRVKEVDNVRVVGTFDNMPEILHRYVIDEVLVVVPRSRLNNIQSIIYACETEGIKVTIAIDLFDLKIARASLTEIDGIPFLRFETTIGSEWHLLIKRGIDIVISGLGIILLSPLFILVTTLIKLSSPGPVFFRQERFGLNCKKFILYKFRTMYVGAQAKLSKVEDINAMNGSEFRKKKLQWITPVGRILRQFSIDELPQLINVFAGHMSLIGPRPTVPEEVLQYRCWQRRRFSMKPGITCLWQINGRNKLSHEEWMKLDLEYLDNWSLWLDFKIFIKTIPAVLFGIGAY